jgi:hypothetical protein
MKRRDFIQTALSAMVLSTILPAVEIEPVDPDIPLGKALFINCLQRTQTQQLLKEYLMVALKSSYKNPKEELPKSIAKYDKRFYVLYDYFMKRLKDEAARQKMEEAKKLWEESKPLLSSAPSRENALKLQESFDKMIHLLGAPKVLKTKKSFAAVRKTGGLCCEPLYMANLYLMELWGVDIPNYEERMKGHIAKFRKNLDFLRNYPNNTEEIKQLIERAGKDFIFFEMMYKQNHTAIPTLISKKADDIFDEIQRIKQLYGKMVL